jgi:hypothetical protein
LKLALKHWGVLKEKTKEKMGRGNMTNVTSQKEWVINFTFYHFNWKQTQPPQMAIRIGFHPKSGKSQLV